MKVYLISGLGADERTFSQLKFPHGTSIHFLPWIKPLKDETMNSYARRMSLEMDTLNGPYTIVGLSFGGMLASEMLTFLQPHKVILLSSVNNYNELPAYYRMAGKTNLYRLFPSRPGKGSNLALNWLFGAHQPHEKVLLDDVLKNTDTNFSRWAIEALLQWRKATTDKEVIRIHGTNDHILPITSFTPQHLIKGAGHLMVLTHAAQVSELIAEVITEARQA